MADWLARHMVNQLTKRVEELEKKLSEKTPEKLPCAQGCAMFPSRCICGENSDNKFDSSLIGEPYFGKLPY
jgi:hypothetical protein